MSDSEDSNLSDLEQEDAAVANGSDSDEENKKELKGILNDVTETNVKWSDLVSFILFCTSSWFCFYK